MNQFNRKLLKENAKKALRNNFWIAFAVLWLGAILGCNWTGITAGGSGGYSASYNVGYSSSSMSTQNILEDLEEAIEQVTDGKFDFSYDIYESDKQNVERFMDEVLACMNMTRDEFIRIIGIVILVVILVIFIINILVMIVSFLFGSFVSAPTAVGVSRFFMKNRMNTGKFKDMFSGFGKGKYMKIVKAMFSSNIRMFLWSLLFYFPGLVKYYQYYFMSYIMAENPDISPERAREISKKMTDGHKWDIFVLELSFIGWGIVLVLIMLTLIIFSCGLLALPSALFAYPLAAYEHATFAELYAERREYALMTGIVTERELFGFKEC